LSDDPFSGFAENVEAGLTGNASFPDPIAAVASITAARLAFQAAVVAARNGGPEQTADKNAKRAVLDSLLRKNAGYVQGIAGDNLTVLLSSGYAATSKNRARYPLPKATIVSLINNYSGMLILNIEPMLNARSYEVQIKNGNAEWASVGIYAYASRITIPNLTPAQTYSVQVRAIGGANGYSDWSDAATRIIT
jgi:hypothetical protein